MEIKEKKDNYITFLHSIPLQLFVITLLVFLVYWNLWRGFFSFDDYWHLGWVRFEPSLIDSLTARIEKGHSLKMLSDAVLWIISQWFGLNASPYYIVSLFQHILVSILLYWLATLLRFERWTAWLGTILFGTTFAANTVVNNIAASGFSLASMWGLLSLCLFILYRRKRRFSSLFLSVLFWGLALFSHDAAISIVPMLLLYDITGLATNFSRKIRLLAIHCIYSAWLIPYSLVQYRLFSGDHSEYAGRFMPGIHVLANYYYLVFMAIPNFSSDPIKGFINRFLPTGWYIIGLIISWVLVAALISIGLHILWKGRIHLKYMVAWIMISFFPFSLWAEPGLAAAYRYLYVPSMGFFLLIADGIVTWWKRDRFLSNIHLLRFLPLIFIILLLALNFTYHQMWIRQQNLNGDLKRAVVDQFLMDFPNPPEGAHFIMEIPELNFGDLAHICVLLYNYPVQCTTYLAGTERPKTNSSVYYILRVHERGFNIIAQSP